MRPGKSTTRVRTVGRDGASPLPKGKNGQGKKGRSVLSCFLMVMFGLASVAIIQWRGAPHAILVGQSAERSIVARVNFSYKDLKETGILREEARKAAPNVYRESLESFNVVARQLKHLYDKPSADVGLSRWDSATALPDGQTRDKELHRCIRSKDFKTYEKDVDALFATLRERGIVPGSRYEMERHATRIRVIRTTGKEETLPVAQLLAAPGYSSEIRNCVQGCFPEYSETCQELLKELLKSELEPTLVFEPTMTEIARSQAANAIHTVLNKISEGQVLLPAGTVATPEHIFLLREEALRHFSSQKPMELASRLGGIAILLAIVAGILIVYLRRFHRRILRARLESIKLGFVWLLTLGTAKAIIWGGFQVPAGGYLIPVYLIPLPFFSVVVAIVYSPRLARVITFFFTIFIAIMAGSSFSVMVVLLFGSFAAVAMSATIRERSKPLKIGIVAGAVQMLASVGLNLLNVGQAGDPTPVCLSSILNGLVIGVALTVLLPVIEKVFGIVTDLTLLELSDQNHPLLRRLALEAPGTYQHTLMVAMLTESAAEAIRANSLLARVGCYYHDVGKTAKPQYFVENENWRGSQHTKLNPSMSSLIITSHTRDGIELAKEYNLPQAIIDFIPQHHGTTLIEYFYRNALKQADDDEQIDESLYRYPGPKPQSRETAITLLADSVEAACRTLENPNPGRIRTLVHEIIMAKLLDDQLDECDMTLNDLRKIEDSFVRNLISFHHRRVKYPGQQD